MYVNNTESVNISERMEENGTSKRALIYSLHGKRNIGSLQGEARNR
jgi:hypothetical protein